MRAAIETLGCKVNQYETQLMAEKLAAAGYDLVDSAQEAEVYIVNSCTVTAESDRKTRQTVRRLKRLHPNALVVLCGCMPQAQPSAGLALPQADIVLGNAGKENIAAILAQHFQGNCMRKSVRDFDGAPAFSQGISGFRERTRAYVKIEDGCDRFCSYCIVPHARGRVRSKPLESIRAECAALANAGFAELVLVGINLSAYGKGLNIDLSDAAAVAAEDARILRVRLGSLEPDHLTPELLARLRGIPRLCPQFHISLQSGCDATLRRMNRHYGTAEYRALCTALRMSFPDCTLTTDVMVGFPGESAADFAESLEFVQEIAFEKVHIFPYSPRASTPAAAMPQQVEKAEKERRCRALLDAAQEIRESYLQAQIGRVLTVLPEEDAKGHSANYTPVRILGGAQVGRLVDVQVVGVDGDCCVGEA